VTELKLRAERRLGELIQETIDHIGGGESNPGRPFSQHACDFDMPGYQAPFYAGNQANNELTLSTTPSSDGYNFPSGIAVSDIGPRGPVMSFSITLPKESDVPEGTIIIISQ